MSGPLDTTDVLIVEEYVPEYRHRFFQMLEGALAAESIRLTVAVGDAQGEHGNAARNDAAVVAGVRVVPARSISVAGRTMTLRRVSALASRAALVVVDQALRHLENYPLLLRSRRGPNVALWGHGARQIKDATRLERLVERRVAMLAHWFFAYTQTGADTIAACGFPRDRITVVQNTVDVCELVRLRKGVHATAQKQLRNELDLLPENVCLYIGALDSSKRIAFLLQAGAILAGRIPGFTLVVAGDGPERRVVETALASSPWLRYVGRAAGSNKARLGSVSDLLLMPGRVGLVAVDSFALQTPIVTTRWPYHAPEVSYLDDGVNARFSGDSVVEFARVVEEVLSDRGELARLKAACEAAAPQYSLETMVGNFAGGVVAALAATRR